MNKKLISCVIVTYHPGDIFYDLVMRLKHERINIIVIDNSDFDVFSNKSEYEFTNFWMGANKGIAAAQNRGIELADQVNSEFVAFLDQDSKLDYTHIINLVGTIRDGKHHIAAPISVNRKTNTPYSPVKISDCGTVRKLSVTDNALIVTNFVISSGTVVRSSVLRKIGFMDEKLFIDYVDTEWCLRADKLGYNIVVNSMVEMEHEIGDGDINCYFFRVPVHSPRRRYYRIRNAFFLFYYPHVPVRLAIRELLVTTLQQVIIICCKENKGDYFKYYVKAVRDGIKACIQMRKQHRTVIK